VQVLAVDMPRSRPRTDRRPVRDPRRLAPDVDMRSVDGSRFASAYDAVALEFPAADPLRIRDVALLRFAAEKAVAVGAWEDVVRLHNLIARKEAPLRAAMRAVTPRPRLVGPLQHFARKTAARAVQEPADGSSEADGS
jgi:hypothetical protein